MDIAKKKRFNYKNASLYQIFVLINKKKVICTDLYDYKSHMRLGMKQKKNMTLAPENAMKIPKFLIL